MNKQEFIDKVSAKVGFYSIGADVELTNENHKDNPWKKHRLWVNTLNKDGTRGCYSIEYMSDGTEYAFYNQEVEVLDTKEPVPNQKKLDALQDYLKANFNAFFIIRFDLANNWAEADTFKLEEGKLTKKTVIVYKAGNSPIGHLEVV